MYIRRIMKCLIAIFVLIFICLSCLCRGQESNIQSSCKNFLKDGKTMFEATPDSRPWLVLVWVSCESLGDNHSLPLVKTCEGALIRDNWVLTVASCFQDCQGGIESVSATVDVGLHSSDVRKEIAAGRINMERIPVQRIYLSENNFVINSAQNDMQKQSAQNMSVFNDLALLRLSSDVRDRGRVISLPNCEHQTSKLNDKFTTPESAFTAFPLQNKDTHNQVPSSRARDSRKVASNSDENDVDSNCVVNSWGGIASPAGVLQEVDLRLLSRDECIQFSGDLNLSQGLVCASVSVNSSTESVTEWERMKSDFQSDCAVQQGTPLVVPEDIERDNMERQCNWNLVGLLSFGMGCHKSMVANGDTSTLFSAPGFFSSVCEHVSWIETTVQQNEALISAACPVLPQPPPNGFICSRGEGSSGSQVKVCCERGYMLQGTALLECDLISGHWEPPTLPQCVPVHCPSLVTPLHGKTYPPACSNSVYQTSCWVSCDQGYSLSHGNGLLTCADDGAWSSALPSCIPTDCGPPPSAGSLLVSHSSTLVGSKAVYTCSHCHMMVGVVNGSVEVVCGSDGTWGGPKPMCTPVYCSELTPPFYGSVQLTSLQCGAYVRYSCGPGFNLIGRSEAKCLNDGTWSSPTPHCTTVACQAPKILGSNFAESNSSYVFGSVIEVECAACRVRMMEGVRTNESTLTCTTEGRWDKPLPTCQWATCPLPGLLANGTIEPLGQLYYCGTTVTFSCDSGFRLSGTNPSICTVNRTWTDEFPTCKEIPVDHCSPPPSPNNHSHFCESIPTRYLHSMVAYCCDEGYKFDSGIGMGLLTCEKSRQWNGTVPTCMPITCSAPILPVGVVISRVQLGYAQGEDYHYGSRLASEYSYGTRLAMSCVSVELHHSVSGAKYLTCGGEGKWDQLLPTCLAIGCSVACEVPAPPRNGRIASIIRPGVGTVKRNSNVYEGLIVGDVAIFMCSHGFYLHGSGSRRCGSNRVWSGQAPLCLRFDQPRSRFIYRNPINTRVWDTADSAHFLSSNTIYLACQISTEGVGIAMPIKKIDGPPLNRRNTRTRAYGSQSRSTQLAIQPSNTAGGHSMAGVYLCEIRSPSNISLLVSKILTVYIHDRLCLTPRPLSHGKLTTMGTVPGSCVHYQCDRGYTLIGGNDRICLRDGTWTGTLPTCLSLFNATCSSAPSVDHASLTTPTPSGSFSINATVTYECNNGYTLVGRSSRRCLGGDRWSKGRPRCVVERK